jgi:hypothetical protein
MFSLAVEDLGREYVNPIEITFETLAAVNNDAVVKVLTLALESRERAVAEGALEAILRCKPRAILNQLVERWHTLPDRWKKIMARHCGAFEGAIIDVFRRRQAESCRNAVEAAVGLGEAQLIEFFLRELEDATHPQRKLAATAVVRLAERLHDDISIISSPRQEDSPVRDWDRTFHRVVGALAISTSRFTEHRAVEVLESFVLLAKRENLTLREILHDSTHPVYRPLIEQMLRSTRAGVMELLLSFLDDPHPFHNALQLLGQRRDVAFLRLLGRKLANDHREQIHHNLCKIHEIGWMKDAVALVNTLGETEQLGIVRFCAQSGIARGHMVHCLKYLAEHGTPATQQSAVLAWIAMRPENLRELLDGFLHSEQPLIRAAALRSLRDSEYPNAITHLLSALNDPLEVIRAAAQESLVEFNFKTFLHAFDDLPPAARKASATLVKKVNPHLVHDLMQEFQIKNRAQRLRALAIAELFELVPQIETVLLTLASDEDHAVRLEAIRLLALCDSAPVREKLVDLLQVHDLAVHQLAEESLTHIMQTQATAGSGEHTL